MVDLAKLVVSMEMENAKLLNKLTQSEKKLKRFEKRSNKTAAAVKQIGKTSAVAAGLVAGSFAAMLKSTLDSSDKMAKLSETTGLTVENLSRLDHAAELSGTSFDAIAKGVGKLQRNMYDANNGLKTYQDAFADLGVTVTESDGSLRDTNAVMLDAADRFSAMEDGAEKAALAQILFGKSGKEMIPLLNQGAAGIKRMTDESDRFGRTLSGSTAAAAARVNDNMTGLSAVLDGVVLNVVSGLLPMVESASEAMLEWGSDTDNITESTEFLSNSIKVTVSAGLLLKGVFKSIALAGASMAAAVVQAAQGNFSQAADIIQMGAEDSDKAWADAMKGIDSVWDEVPRGIAGKSAQAAKDIASPVTKASAIVQRSGEAMKADVEQIKKDMESASKDFVDIGNSFDQRLNDLASPAGGNAADLTVLDAGSGVLDAQQALEAGDFEGAIKKAAQAFDLLEQMKQAGTESELILGHFGEKLKEVALAAQESKIADISAQLDVDEQASVANVVATNQKMQAALAANPLVQVVQTMEAGGAVPVSAANDGVGINPDVVPSRSHEAQPAKPEMQPVYLQMPDGSAHPFYGDKRAVDNARRDFSKEARKRGTR